MRKRQKIQHELAFEDAGRGEAPRSSEGRVETTAAGLGTESQANTDKLIEEVMREGELEGSTETREGQRRGGRG